MLQHWTQIPFVAPLASTNPHLSCDPTNVLQQLSSLQDDTIADSDADAGAGSTADPEVQVGCMLPLLPAACCPCCPFCLVGSKMSAAVSDPSSAQPLGWLLTACLPPASPAACCIAQLSARSLAHSLARCSAVVYGMVGGG